MLRNNSVLFYFIVILNNFTQAATLQVINNTSKEINDLQAFFHGKWQDAQKIAPKYAASYNSGFYDIQGLKWNETEITKRKIYHGDEYEYEAALLERKIPVNINWHTIGARIEIGPDLSWRRIDKSMGGSVQTTELKKDRYT